MKAFVTGATGLLGGNLVRALAERGVEVKALARSAAKAKELLADLDGVEIVIGDMEDPPAFADALRGCDVLFHTAAYFRETFGQGDHWPELERINITHTLWLFALAEQAGVRRIVHTSSVAAIGQRADGQAGDETTPPDPEPHLDPYARSKVLGDRAIAGFAREHRIEIVTVMPGWILGPWDAAPTGGGQFVVDHLKRALPGVLDSGIDVVDARDVVAVMLAAAERGRPGRRYIAVGHHVSQAELVAGLERVSGVPAARNQIPTWLAVSLAWLAQTWASLSGRPSLLSVDGIRALTRKKRSSAAKAQRELGVTFRPLDDTLRAAVAWVRQHRSEWLRGA